VNLAPARNIFHVRKTPFMRPPATPPFRPGPEHLRPPILVQTRTKSKRKLLRYTTQAMPEVQSSFLLLLIRV